MRQGPAHHHRDRRPGDGGTAWQALHLPGRRGWSAGTFCASYSVGLWETITRREDVAQSLRVIVKGPKS